MGCLRHWSYILGERLLITMHLECGAGLLLHAALRQVILHAIRHVKCVDPSVVLISHLDIRCSLVEASEIVLGNTANGFMS